MIRSRLARLLLQCIFLPLPWAIRRQLLISLLGFRIADGAAVGRSLIDSAVVRLGEGSRVGTGTVIRSLDLLELGPGARIGNLNWVYAHASDHLGMFEDKRRKTHLIIREQAAITHRHLIDCTDLVEVGAYATVAGHRSQLLTHSIELAASEQSANPIIIGPYSFVGTQVVILGGAVLPERSVLGAGSVLRDAFDEPLGLFSGVPAQRVRDLSEDRSYFTRERGIVR